MKYGDYHLPSGVDFSSITYEDIRWQYGVFRCNSTGSGRDKKHLPWDGVKTNLGEIEEKDWCRLADAVIERDGETHLLKHLIQWCSEHNYMCGTNAAIRFPPLHKSRSTMRTTGQSPAHTAEDGVNSSFWESGFSRSHWFPA